jgi:hypothetical protein
VKAGAEASRQVGEVPKRHTKGKAGSEKDAVKAAAVAAGAEHDISKRTVERAFAKADDKEKSAERIARAKAAAEKRKAKREADRKERAERFRSQFGFGAREGDGSWQRLAKVLVMLGSDHEGEQQNAADAANKILQPMGWQPVKVVEKQRSTLPQDDALARFQAWERGAIAANGEPVHVDDIGDIPACLDRAPKLSQQKAPALARRGSVTLRR